MKAWYKIILIFVLFTLTGCTSIIRRYGYNLQDVSGKNACSSCSAQIKHKFQYNKDDVEILGSIKAGDTGFSVKCNKGYVLGIFKREGCALGADLVNITYERGIDLWSSCYRAKADFLRFKDRDKAKALESI